MLTLQINIKTDIKYYQPPVQWTSGISHGLSRTEFEADYHSVKSYRGPDKHSNEHQSFLGYNTA